MAAAGKNNPAEAPPVMTAKELCKYLSIHKSTLYRLIKTGQFPYFRIGTDFRFSREAIDEWRLAQNGQRTMATPPPAGHAADLAGPDRLKQAR